MGLRDWLPSFRTQSSAPAEPDAPCKWLPVISHDDCTGCALCFNACNSGCIDMVWDFATLTQPQDCGGEGHCAEACPADVIRMDWVPATGNRQVGVWRESAAAGN
jgi:formate hydrogenlyase subunit 6/NADH:ubiquinone oxidoreductase subunit I